MSRPPAEILRALDDPDRLEFPEGFDQPRERARFAGLVNGLQAAFGCDCRHESGSAIQDASHLGTIDVPASATELETPIHVRISNFGLALVCPDRPGAHDAELAAGLVSDGDLRRVDDLVVSSGYVRIPESILWTRYDGASVALRSDGRSTWFTRFFDYL